MFVTCLQERGREHLVSSGHASSLFSGLEIWRKKEAEAGKIIARLTKLPIPTALEGEEMILRTRMRSPLAPGKHCGHNNRRGNNSSYKCIKL